MTAFQLKELEAKEIQSFFETHPQGSFAQSVEMGSVREDLGRTIRYLAVYENNKIVAGCQVSIIPGRITSADITMGPLLDFENKKLLQFFTESIREYLKQYKCAYLTISPHIPYSEKARAELQKLGWKYSGRINASAVGIRGGVRWMYIKDLEGQTEENYQDAYVKRHRRYIRNHDTNLSIRQLNRDELPLFIKIMKHTAERRQFANRKDSYFYSLFDHFGKKAQFKVVELKTEDGVIPIAAIVFIEANGEVASYLGGALSQYTRYRASYLLHDDMIRYAIQCGYKRYNFYGIEGKLDDPRAEGYGIYEFKAKFGTGHPVELIGEFVLPLQRLAYATVAVRHKLKK